MAKYLGVALSLIARGTAIVLIMAGLTYVIYPRIGSSTGPWSQFSDSSAARSGVPPDTLPSSVERFIGQSGPAAKNAIPVDIQVTPATLTATTSRTPALASPTTASTAAPRSTVVNQATIDYMNVLATAETSLNTAATPSPTTVASATPPTSTATATSSPQPTSIALVIVTETPTPVNMITAAAIAARATAVATAIGTYTPMPFNWVVPIVVTPEPATAIPANSATAAFQVAEATAAAFVNGTPTPTPVNVWTATPTPYMWPVIGEVATPWLPPSPTPTPLPIPQELVGKILFLSNRSGGPQPLSEPLVYAIDPDGSNLAVLNDDTFYRLASARDAYSADQRYRTFTRDVSRYYGQPPEQELALAIFYYDYQSNVTEQATFFGTGDAWDPVWSPTQEQIALVSDVSQHAEIWIANRDGSGQLQLTDTNGDLFAREIGKNTFVDDDRNGHPSWSPDGFKIVYWSLQSGHRQIWVMNADGSNAYSLSTTGYDDWGPIWVKYTDPPREPVLGISQAASSASTQTDQSTPGNE